jgi:hypothetical protein
LRCGDIWLGEMGERLEKVLRRNNEEKKKKVALSGSARIIGYILWDKDLPTTMPTQTSISYLTLF